jgi:DNA sulfur modification protein DndD
MILQSIELKNFMCYYGENKFDFTEGINVIIGDNGYGKSKLYDAFYWVMYDKCFDTSKKEFRQTSQLKRLIVSDKAVKEVVDGTVTTSVKLTFHDQVKDSIYILERSYNIQKVEEGIKEDKDSQQTIYKKDLAYLNAREVNDPDQIEQIKNLILPENIKPYMWFQGEQVESIIDFNKQDTLTQAINVLSNISRFDGIKELAIGLNESAANELNRKVRSLSKDKGKSEQLELERQTLLERTKGLQTQELQLRDNLAKAEENSELLINKLEEAQNIRQLEEKRKDIEKQLIDTISELEQEHIFLHKKMFTNRWVLKGCGNLFEEYSKKYSTYDFNKLKKKAELQAKIDAENAVLSELQTRLPIDVPEPIYVERMLADEHCLVCDREAKKGSDAWNKINELLTRQTAKLQILNPEELSLHNFSGDFKRLYQNGLGLQYSIENVDKDIAETFRRQKRINNKRKNLHTDLISIESQIQNLISESGIGVKEAKDLLSSYTIQNDFAKSYQKQVSDLENKIRNNQEKLKTIEDQLNSLVTGEIPRSLLSKVEVLKDFEKTASETRNRVFSQLVNVLEVEANKHYNDMTKGNLSARGIIKLKELSNGNFMPELVDSDGNVLLQLNTGNIILIKLATIMAIISARQGSRATDLYTLITDAPMSVFGEDYTIGFCKTVSKVYRQSIIMSKEFYRNENLRNELLNNSEIKVGKVYMITPSIPETERSNRESLTTNITALN